MTCLLPISLEGWTSKWGTTTLLLHLSLRFLISIFEEELQRLKGTKEKASQRMGASQLGWHPSIWQPYAAKDPKMIGWQGVNQERWIKLQGVDDK